MTTMRLLSVTMVALLVTQAIVQIHGLDTCQSRSEMASPGRCNKPCRDDRDCTSRRKACKCDGICGRSCIRMDRPCEFLPSLRNGVVEMPGKMFGAVAMYECNNGYKLSGTSSRVCQGDGKWSDDEPVCIRMGVEKDPYSSITMCDPPPEYPNARHDGNPGEQHVKTTMIRYTCNEGFTKAPDAIAEAWCPNGKWVGPTNFACLRVSCPRVEGIRNGFVSQEAVSYPGYNASYSCQSGFELAGKYIRLCNYLGEWEGIAPSCEKVTCSRPLIVDNAHHDGDQQRYPARHVLKYECDNGYYSEGQSEALCTSSGYWQGPTVMCSPVKCPRPEEVVNGWWSGHVYTFPHSVTYSCHKGYELRGDAMIRCKDTGRWSDKAPYCEPVKCPQLLPPANGKMIGHGNTFGTNVTIECNPSHRLIGSWTRRCEADRTWSGEPAECHEIACMLPVFYNGYILSQNIQNRLQENGSSISFICQPDTAPDDAGSLTAVCLESGQWSVPAPTCWGMCHPPDVANGTIPDGYRQPKYKHSKTVPYRCNTGLIPGRPLTCYNGTWSEAQCIPASCKDFPPHVQNGMRVFVGLKHGDQAKYTCHAGYQLQGMINAYLTCEFGRWVGGKPQCEEIYCKNPGSIGNGQVYKKVEGGRFVFQPYITTIRHGHRLEYQCNKGFRLDGPGGATCVNGEWQPSRRQHRPHCVKATHPPFITLWKALPNMH